MKKLHKHILVAGQINLSDFSTLKEAGITVIINNRPDGEEPDQLTAEQAAEQATKHDIDYHYLPMPNGQPLAPGLVEEFRAIVKNNEGNILTHCRSGMRSSFLWALGAIADGEVTVDEAINAGQAAGIPLQNARAALETAQP